MEDPPRRRPGELSQLPHYRKRQTSVPLAEVLNDALTSLWVDKRLAAASVAFHIAEDVDRVLRPCTVGAFPLDQEGVAFLLLRGGAHGLESQNCVLVSSFRSPKALAIFSGFRLGSSGRFDVAGERFTPVGHWRSDSSENALRDSSAYYSLPSQAR